MPKGPSLTTAAPPDRRGARDLVLPLRRRKEGSSREAQSARAAPGVGAAGVHGRGNGTPSTLEEVGASSRISSATLYEETL